MRDHRRQRAQHQRAVAVHVLRQVAPHGGRHQAGDVLPLLVLGDGEVPAVLLGDVHAIAGTPAHELVAGLEAFEDVGALLAGERIVVDADEVVCHDSFWNYKFCVGNVTFLPVEIA
jgi:hypothetical protein